jgi:glycosyltransferase involved in cell wall biosynthesis
MGGGPTLPRVRIAFTHAFCWPEVRRGAERFVPGLGTALVRRGHEVTHFSSAWQHGREVVDGVKTVRLRRRREEQYAHEADFGRRLLPHLVAGGFDAVHSLGRRDAVASIRAARAHPGRRTVFTDLGLPTRDYWRPWRKESRAVEKVVAGVDVYSGMSRCALDYLEREYGRTDGVVVPGGVDLGAFKPAQGREPRPTILFSGFLNEPHKEVPLLLEALPIVAEAEPEVELWLSGPGDEGPLLEEAPPAARARTRSLGLGEVDRQHERYGRAWLTCLPSRYDSFGMVLVESLACGTPIVTTTEGAPQELVDPAVNGELCTPGDAQSLAQACLRTFELARNPQTVAACRASAEPYDWDKGLAPLAEAIYSGGRRER